MAILIAPSQARWQLFRRVSFFFKGTGCNTVLQAAPLSLHSPGSEASDLRRCVHGGTPLLTLQQISQHMHVLRPRSGSVHQVGMSNLFRTDSLHPEMWRCWLYVCSRPAFLLHPLWWNCTLSIASVIVVQKQILKNLCCKSLWFTSKCSKAGTGVTTWFKGGESFYAMNAIRDRGNDVCHSKAPAFNA